jgi:hypothetical protein
VEEALACDGPLNCPVAFKRSIKFWCWVEEEEEGGGVEEGAIDR